MRTMSETKSSLKSLCKAASFDAPTRFYSLNTVRITQCRWAQGSSQDIPKLTSEHVRGSIEITTLHGICHGHNHFYGNLANYKTDIWNCENDRRCICDYMLKYSNWDDIPRPGRGGNTRLIFEMYSQYITLISNIYVPENINYKALLSYSKGCTRSRKLTYTQLLEQFFFFEQFLLQLF